MFIGERKSWWYFSRGRQEYELKRIAFYEKYGADLGDSAEIYANRTHAINGWVYARGQWIKIEEIIPKYAQALAEKLEAQSPKTRSEWLKDFLEDLDKLVPPTKGQINLNF